MNSDQPDSRLAYRKAPDKDLLLKRTPLFPINTIRIFSLSIWIFAVILQALLWASPEDIASAAMAMIGGTTGTIYSLRRNLLRAAPISTIMVLGYTAYYFILPPLATIAELHPLTYNLNHPELVFFHALLGLSTIISAHWIYRRLSIFQNFRWLIANKIYRPLGLFSHITYRELLFIGFIGLAAMAFQIFVAGAAQQDAQGVGNKIMQGLYPLAYLPFLLLLKDITPAFGRLNIKWWVILITYIALLIAVSMARNARASFLIGVASVILCYSYGLAAGVVSNRLIKLKYIAPIGIAGVLLIGPVADLATAMVIVRAQRADISPVDLLTDTLFTFGDKDAIRTQRLEDIQEKSKEWDERYTDNIFMARLSNLKFTDSSLDLVLRMDRATRDYMREIEWQRVLVIFPRPVLAFIAPSINKDDVGAASGGDLLLFAVTHNPHALGGFRTGSLLASAFALFGWLYPAFLGLVLLPLFSLADAQTTRIKNGNTYAPLIAPVSAIMFFTWFYWLTSAATGVESFSDLFEHLLRGWIQIALIWAIVSWIARWICKIRINGVTR